MQTSPTHNSKPPLRNRALCASIAILGFLSAASVSAAQMRPGLWQASTQIISAEGPGVASATPPKEPMTVKYCMAQSFVDKEQYTSVAFAMDNPKRNGFDCKIDSEKGNEKKKEWAYTCTRADGAKVVNVSQVEVKNKSVEQASTVSLYKGDVLDSKIQVKASATFVAEQCGDTAINLR